MIVIVGINGFGCIGCCILMYIVEVVCDDV